MSILSYECIVSVDSLDSLVELYEKRGQTFQSEKDFLKFLKHDWRESVTEFIQRKKAEEYEKKDMNQPLEVTVDEISYKIYGIIPDKKFVPKEYVDDLIKRLRKEEGKLFFEQGIYSEYFKGWRGLEINDHYIFSPFYHVMNAAVSFKNGFFSPLVDTGVLVYFMTYYLAQIWYKDAIEEFICKGRKVINDRKVKNYFLLHMMTSEGFRHLPSYVELEIKQRDKLSLNPVQKRSAYMAEFVRQYPSEGKRNKVLVAGAAHASEIKYFLIHGVNDTKICKKAEKNFELSYYAPPIYERSIDLTFKKELCHILGNVIGIGALVYGIGQLFS